MPWRRQWRGRRGRTDNGEMRHALKLMDVTEIEDSRAEVRPAGEARLVVGAEHFRKIVRGGILTAKVSLDIMTADFKAMLVPEEGRPGAPSIVEWRRRPADARGDSRRRPRRAPPRA